MKVTINDDEKSVRDIDGKNYEIAGLVIKKPNSSNDIYHAFGSRFCNVVCCKGHTHIGVRLENGKVDLI